MTLRRPAGTASTSSVARRTTTGLLDAAPRRTAASGSLVLAAANTSGLTPWRICAASSSEPANESATVASSNVLAVGGERVFSDAAADTVSVAVVAAAAAAGERQRAATASSAAASRLIVARSTITDVAFTVAVAAHAGREPELLDRVARDRRGDEERAGLDLDQRHHAVDLDRAHDAGEAVAGRQRVAGRVAARARARGRSTSAARHAAAGCARRATVRSLPARSQRRSVSALTPIAFAASPRVRSCGHLPKHCIGRSAYGVWRERALDAAAVGAVDLDLPDRRLGLDAVDQRAGAGERLAAVRRARRPRSRSAPTAARCRRGARSRPRTGRGARPPASAIASQLLERHLGVGLVVELRHVARDALEHHDGARARVAHGGRRARATSSGSPVMRTRAHRPGAAAHGRDERDLVARARTGSSAPAYSRLIATTHSRGAQLPTGVCAIAASRSATTAPSGSSTSSGRCPPAHAGRRTGGRRPSSRSEASRERSPSTNSRLVAASAASRPATAAGHSAGAALPAHDRRAPARAASPRGRAGRRSAPRRCRRRRGCAPGAGGRTRASPRW